MSRAPADKPYAFRHWWRWQRGRQGSGYDKLLLWALPWPIPMDAYLIHYPEGSSIPPHRDPVVGRRHYRLNIILKASPAGGEFVCEETLWSSSRIKCFRPDVALHSVTPVVGGGRWVLSLGWLWGKDPSGAQRDVRK